MKSARSSTRISTCATALACVVGTTIAGCASVSPPSSRDALADAERAFAARAAVIGVRDAFIESFADDGLVFEPLPVRVRDVWPTRAPPQGAPTQRLEWHPEMVGVARAGDLGWSTGPFRVVDLARAESVAHGAFFSVWQRQAHGEWRVWLDMGASTDAPVDAAMWRAPPRAPVTARAAGAPDGIDAAALLALDAGLSRLAPRDFAQRMAIDARRYGKGEVALVGPAWTEALERTGAADYQPVEARVAASGDLAASHGRLLRTDSNGTVAPARYVHLWVRDQDAWFLAIEVMVAGG